MQAEPHSATMGRMKTLAALLLFAGFALADEQPAASPATTGTHSIALSWGSTGTATDTYNVYSALGACPAKNPNGVLPAGSFTKLNGAPVAGLTYGISSLPPSTTYCLVVSSQNTAGVESCTAGLANAATACPAGNPLTSVSTPPDSVNGPNVPSSPIVTVAK